MPENNTYVGESDSIGFDIDNFTPPSNEVKQSPAEPFDPFEDSPQKPKKEDPKHKPPPQKKQPKKKSTVSRKNCLRKRGVNFPGHYSGGDRPVYFGCDDPYLSLGASNSTKKANHYLMSAHLRYFLQKHTNTCANRAAKKAGVQSKVDGVHLSVFELYRASTNVPGKRSSFHTTGRAIDISMVTIFTRNGRKKTFNMGKRPTNKSFYHGFNNCIREKIVARCPHRGWAKKGRSQGVIDWTDHDHTEHIHLALPYCDPNQHPPGVLTL